MEHILSADGFIMALLVCFAVAGTISWLSEIFMGTGLGLFGDTILAAFGAMLAERMLPQFGLTIASGLPGIIASAAIGAVAVLLAMRLIQRAA